MSSSDFDFGDDDLDDAALHELDAIEASLTQVLPTQPVAGPSNPKPRIEIDLSEDSFDTMDNDFELDDAALQTLDNFIHDVYEGRSKPMSYNLANTRQTTLTGEILPRPPPASTSTSKTVSHAAPASRQPSRKTKQWDHTQFAKTGAKQKGKSKGSRGNNGGNDQDEEMEFEQFPSPFVQVGPVLPMKLVADMLATKHWIYPLNQSKRDYQYNIVKACLFDNTIVALPTGMGKTFIAGCVMLNYYRWFPEGKVIFVAPTKPLVAQQIEACHRTCGIPGSDAIELTGATEKAKRYQLWKEKRVFYMTPQTLINDLEKENCDAQDIVLLVIDEAHRGTGEYAYTRIVRFMQSKNPHFRILALTATPGGNPDAVQTLVDNLHISHIEIRDETSLDLRPYAHEKDIREHIIQTNKEIDEVKDLLLKVMEKQAKSVRASGVHYCNNLVGAGPFSFQVKASELNSNQKGLFRPLMNLSDLARGMGYLIEGTIGMLHNHMSDLMLEPPPSAKEDNKAQRTASRRKGLAQDPDFRKAIDTLDAQKATGYAVHPKMDCLKRLIIDHFGQTLAEDGTTQQETRAMIFVSFREAVGEIVAFLNTEQPLLKATAFIGQGTDKKGNKGLTQKEQLNVIQQFKAGEFNILVATSIGEEGLDIGEVDLIVCYDSQKTPIRMLQRSGRTGRKRDGVVHVLLSHDRERDNWSKSNDAYKSVQKSIIRGQDLELYNDVPRLLPDHVKPECLEKTMEIQEYVREDGKRKRASTAGSTKPRKRARNDDIMRNIPSGATTGFVPVSELVAKAKGSNKKVRKLTEEEFDAAGESDDLDDELEGRVPPRRTQSAKERSSHKKKPRLKKAKTIATSTQRPKKPRSKTPEVTFSQKDQDDSVDFELEALATSLAAKPTKSQAKPIDLSDSEAEMEPNWAGRGPSPSATIDITDSEPESGAEESPSNMEDIEKTSLGGSRMSWLDDEDDASDLLIVQASPVRRKRIDTDSGADEDTALNQLSEEEGGDDSPAPTFAVKHPSQRRKVELQLSSSPVKSIAQPNQPSKDEGSHDGPAPTFATQPPRRKRRRVELQLSSSPVKSVAPPPDEPSEDEGSHDGPAPTFAVQPPRRKRRRVELQLSSSPVKCVAPQRLHRERPPDHVKTKKPKVSAKHNSLFDFQAEHSGNEVSAGSSEEDEESESDRRFLHDTSSPTRPSPSYQQTQAYRGALMTQVPQGGPAFIRPPVRPNKFGRISRPEVQVSSSPERNSEPDEYAMDSFVVADEDPITYSDLDSI